MTNSRFIPGSDPGFHAWQTTWYVGTEQHLEDWNIPSTAFMPLGDPRELWEMKYAAALNPATRTTAAVLAKTEARKGYESDIRSFVRSFQTYNLAITDEERREIGLPVHKTGHTPAPVPDKAPICRIDISTNGWVILYFKDALSKTKAKPPGVHGCEGRWAILDAPTMDVDDLVHSAFDTNSPMKIEFQGHDRGKTVYIALRWENTRGEKGPWSTIFSTLIP